MTTTLTVLEQLVQIERWKDDAAWQRVREQLRFAQWMTQQKGAKPAWQRLLDKAMTHVAASAHTTEPRALVAEVEAMLAPMSAAAKAYTVFCAGHAHIDMNWQWGWPETVNVTLDTLRTMLTLLDEFPEFHFSQSQASVYAIVEQYEPAMLARIAEFVKQGRWEVTASHWVENDPNLASAEALAQHLLQTRAYMKQLFDLAPEDVAIDFAPDSFGFAATTPSYLAQGGVRHVFLHRPGCFLQPVPEVFWWQGPDGARVLVHNAQRRAYNCTIDPWGITYALDQSPSLGLDCGLLFYGVGDHGGGPTRRDLLFAREMQQWPIFPTIKLTASRAYYEHVERSAAAKKLPVIADELNVEVTGCYTTQTLIKRDNRIGEARMTDAETVAAFAAMLDHTVPAPDAEFDTNWRRVLFSHFHDILPGSCVRDTRMYCHGQFQEIMAFSSATTARLLRAIADDVDTSAFRPCATLPQPPVPFLLEGFGAGSGIAAVDGAYGLAHGHGVSPVRPFVVFNTTARERTEVVRFTLWDREFYETAGLFRNLPFEAVDASGKLLPAQHIADGFEWGHSNKTYAVRLTIPPCGYTTLAFRQRLGDAQAPAQTPGVRLLDTPHHCGYIRQERSTYGMENEHVRVVLDAATGRVVSLFDKAANAEMLAPAVGIALEYSVERSEDMSAWIIDSAGPVVTPRLASMQRKQSGPLSATIDLVYKIERSTLRLTYRLDAGARNLGIDFSADWLEFGTSETGSPNLRLAVGTALAQPRATYEIPFGAITRPPLSPDKEVPALRWALLESAAEPRALLVMNDCKHGHALDGATLRVNLIRSGFVPDPFPELGQHKTAFGIEVVAAGEDPATIIAKAQAFNHPLLVVGTPVHEGKLATHNAFVSVSGKGVSVSCVKRAADRNGFVVRLCNTLDTSAAYKLAFDKSFGKPKTVTAVDILERPAGTAPKTIPAKGILTLRVVW